MHRCGASSDECILCGLTERRDHIFQCSHQQEWRDKFITKLDKKLRGLETAADIRHSFISNIQTWLNETTTDNLAQETGDNSTAQANRNWMGQGISGLHLGRLEQRSGQFLSSSRKRPKGHGHKLGHVTHSVLMATAIRTLAKALPGCPRNRENTRQQPRATRSKGQNHSNVLTSVKTTSRGSTHFRRSTSGATV